MSDAVSYRGYKFEISPHEGGWQVQAMAESANTIVPILHAAINDQDRDRAILRAMSYIDECLDDSCDEPIL